MSHHHEANGWGKLQKDATMPNQKGGLGSSTGRRQAILGGGGDLPVRNASEITQSILLRSFAKSQDKRLQESCVRKSLVSLG